jgi:hypothetical protein
MNGEQPGLVIVRGATGGFVQEITAGPHHLRSDEATFFSVRWALARR